MDNIAREQIFNSPVECALRLLIVLEKISPKSADIDRLLVYDYLLVHSGEADDGPESLHPPSPLQGGELIVRRGLLENGLRLLTAKSLAEQRFSSEGISYAATEYAKPFLQYFESAYFERANEIASWVVGQFQAMDSDSLQAYAKELLGRWGAEFVIESSLEDEGAGQ